MGYSIRSLAEVITCLHKAKRREYITEQEFKEHYEFAFNLMKMMVAFKEKIKLWTYFRLLIFNDFKLPTSIFGLQT
jgi:hypothetical protein